MRGRALADRGAMPPEPQILAAFVQGTLDVVRRCESQLGRSISDRVPAPTLERIGSASAISWLPLRDDVDLTAALFAVAGEERSRLALREVMAEAMEKRFLRALTQGASALLGRSPERLVRWAPRVWEAIYRNAGHLVAQCSDAAGELELLDAPQSIVASPCYFEGTAAAVEGALAWFGADAQCRVVEGAARPTIAVRWKP